MKYITEIIKYFTFITTGIVILFVAILLIQGGDSISLKTLIGMPCLGLVTAVVTVFLYPAEARTRREFWLKLLLHYFVLCVVISVFGMVFGWIGLSFKGILLMMVCTAAVYAFTYAVAYLSSKNDADELNQALKKRKSK